MVKPWCPPAPPPITLALPRHPTAPAARATVLHFAPPPRIINSGGQNVAEKKYWRCNVCDDIHYGTKPPEVYPTCHVRHAYLETDAAEAGWVTAL